jgi:hypothetical protein
MNNAKNDTATVGLIAKATPAKDSKITGTAKAIVSIKECSCKKSVPAKNSTQLVELVKQAEEMLIKNGINSIGDRICILRGIYYGTEWSMDYEKEKSDFRNYGFMAYTLSIPKDARPLLKCCNKCKSNLYESLLQSPEVNLGTNKGFDWGHAIIGLDCRRSIISTDISSGLENCTWLGDIGGGAGMLSYRRTINAKIRAKSIVFDSVHDYGCSTNLEGDIGGYLIARKIKMLYKDETGLDDNVKYIYEALNKYLIEEPSEWDNRGIVFLQMLGGKFDDDRKLTNKDELIKRISKKITNFADIYITFRSFDRNYSHDLLKEASRHFYGTANEVSSIFVDALLNIKDYPHARLSAVTNPEPSEPGEIWFKYKALKKIEDEIRSKKKSIDETRKILKRILREIRI